MMNSSFNHDADNLYEAIGITEEKIAQIRDAFLVIAEQRSRVSEIWEAIATSDKFNVSEKMFLGYVLMRGGAMQDEDADDESN